MQSSLDTAILDCFDAGLESIGNAPKKMIYWYLLEKFRLPREKISENPGGFLDALRQLFGQGAGVLEKTIVRALKQKFKITLGEDLVEVLSLIRQIVRPSETNATLRNPHSSPALQDGNSTDLLHGQTTPAKKSHSHPR
jgi:hypothetical protein